MIRYVLQFCSVHEGSPYAPQYFVGANKTATSDVAQARRFKWIGDLTRVTASYYLNPHWDSEVRLVDVDDDGRVTLRPKREQTEAERKGNVEL